MLTTVNLATRVKFKVRTHPAHAYLSKMSNDMTNKRRKKSLFIDSPANKQANKKVLLSFPFLWINHLLFECQLSRQYARKMSAWMVVNRKLSLIAFVLYSFRYSIGKNEIVVVAFMAASQKCVTQLSRRIQSKAVVVPCTCWKLFL